MHADVQYETLKEKLRNKYTSEEFSVLTKRAENLGNDTYSSLCQLDYSLNMLRTWLKESENTVFFGGAGVSTASGVPDFRSENGLYNKDKSMNPEDVLDPYYLSQYPKRFYKYFKENFLAFNPEPNTTHKLLAKMEERGTLKAVVTQNVDGLHQKAGFKTVYELHGNLRRYYCLRHHHEFVYEDVDFSGDYPKCPLCKSLLRPDMTLYHELVNWYAFKKAQDVLDEADLLLVAGTSLTVEPAAGLVTNFVTSSKRHSVYIDENANQFDTRFSTVLPLDLNTVMQIVTKEN